MAAMTLDTIRKHNIVHKYLRGKLTPEEVIEFEVFVLDKPELIEELELDGAFSACFPDAIAEPAKPAFDWRQFWHFPALSSAATIMFALLVWTVWPEPAASPAQHSGLGAAQVVYFDTLRSGDQAPRRLHLQPGITNLTLVLTPTHFNQSPYQVELANQRSTAFSVSDLTINGMGELTLSIPAGQLDAGLYQVTITSAMQQSETITLDIHKQG